MTNEPKGNNLVSKEKFTDFRLDAEYKVSPKGNSGIYLRGRYEMQVLDDAGRTDDREHGHMSIYSAKAPLVNASKAADEWQTVQITVVGNCVSATLNGQKIHDNSKIARITGGALDAKETEPGPIMIQGDHEKVWYRKVVVTPIAGNGGGERESSEPGARTSGCATAFIRPSSPAPASARFSSPATAAELDAAGGMVFLDHLSSLRAASNKGFERPRPAGSRLQHHRSSTGCGRHNHTVAAGRCMHAKHHRE